MALSVNTVTFCLLSFEGPDRYAQAGGLGVRITHLAETLARQGFETHLFFVGDPALPGYESQLDGRLNLYRWCQWISAYYPTGVYAGEEGKLRDFNASLPPFLIEQVIKPAIAAGRLPVILAEEWHTAEALIHLHDRLEAAGLRQRCVLFWNANNTMSFHRVSWSRLGAAAQLTTVSRYMKHLMWTMNLNPLVIPNGIPANLLLPVEQSKISTLRNVLAPDKGTVMLFKAGRFDPAKRWLMAVEAAAKLKQAGCSIVFPLRGGIEEHSYEVFARARELGLSIADVYGRPESWDELIALMRAAPQADIYNLSFFMTQEMLRPFYAAADAVLANSGHEPFGLVGLEAMAAGGIVFTGATGEEYTLCGECAVVLDTDSPDEILSQVLDLKSNPLRVEAMRPAARRQATAFTWEQVSNILLDKVKFVARSSGALPQLNGYAAGGQVRDVLVYTAVHQPRRLRLPAEPLAPEFGSDKLTEAIFDERLNERYFRKAATNCYYPAISCFESLLEYGLKFAIGFSLSFIAQAQRWDKELLNRFRSLVRHGNVELVVVEPAHSIVLLGDMPHFVKRMRLATKQLEKIFGQRPVVADTSELMMSDVVYQALEKAGFESAFLNSRSGILDWRHPTHLYHHGQKMKLFARHHQLSDDVALRFSDQGWGGWPLMADDYANRMASNPGDLVVLNWDFETFGRVHPAESGIFDFLTALAGEVQRAGLSFIKPSEAVKKYGAHSYDLPLPSMVNPQTDGSELDLFLGNEAQQTVFNLMLQAYNTACLTEDPTLIELAVWLAQPENLHVLQRYDRFGLEVSDTTGFTPREWWPLGMDGIAREIQQVYENFTAAIDPYSDSAKAVTRRTPINAKSSSLVMS